MAGLMDIIKGRKSVRTFDGNPVKPEDKEKLEKYIGTITNPFGIPVRFVLMDAKEHGLSSPVINGETMYVAGITARLPRAEEAYGYAFEKLVLYAWSLGIGTTWIGGTMKREVFEQAAGVSAGEIMPCVSPLGHPAEKRAIRETLMRKGVGADSRLSAEKIFFDGAWDRGLPAEKQAPIADLIEMVRWAPSAVNKQPWRVIVTDDGFHFYEKRDKGYISDKTGDLQRIDVGIALCHFVTGLEEKGEKPVIVTEDPGFAIPENAAYIATVKRQ